MPAFLRIPQGFQTCAQGQRATGLHLVWLSRVSLTAPEFFSCPLIILVVINKESGKMKTARHVRQNTGLNVLFHETCP